MFNQKITAMSLVLLTSLLAQNTSAQQAPSNAQPTIRIDQNGNAIPLGNTKETKEVVVRFPTEREKLDQALGKLKSRALTPQDYNDLKQLNLDLQKSQASPYPNTAKPVTRTIAVNLDSGVQPPVLRLSKGMQTAIVFSDMNGSPWNVDYVSYDQSMFQDDKVDAAASESSSGTNIVSLSPKQAAAYGNISIALKGLSTPIMFVLTTGQNSVDFRVDAKVAGSNPDSTYQTAVYKSYPSIDEALTAFLDGVTPDDAKELKFEDSQGARAWVYQNNLYIKTKGTIAYPAFMASAKSTSGSNVYRFNGFKSSVTIMQNGQIFSAYPKN